MVETPPLCSLEPEEGPEQNLPQQIRGSKSLLTEIVRRASYDWVLYREDERPSQRALAAEAESWLFLEKPGHPVWEDRKNRGELGMSFLGICEALGLDPDKIRDGIRALTPHKIRTLGRIPTNRSRKGEGRVDAFADDVSMVTDFPAGLKEAISEESDVDSIDDDVKSVLLGEWDGI